jgi:hypothetical protein
VGAVYVDGNVTLKSKCSQEGGQEGGERREGKGEEGEERGEGREEREHTLGQGLCTR